MISVNVHIGYIFLIFFIVDVTGSNACSSSSNGDILLSTVNCALSNLVKENERLRNELTYCNGSNDQTISKDDTKTK